MKLLLIEDPVNQQASLGAGLRELGYAVDLVVDGIQAIERAAGSDYDIIVLDLMLPRDTSLLVLHEIRELNREVDILILSTQDQIHDRVTALIQGADDYLVKPVSCAELHARIQELVQRNDHLDSIGPNLQGRPPRPGQPDPRIGDLLRFCEADDIELVISEVRLAALLQRISSALESVAAAREIELLIPDQRMPTLLADAKWMEQLLANLVYEAITHSSSGSRVELQVSSNGEHCRIDIESRGALAYDLTPIRRFAKHLNLQVDSSAGEAGRLRVGIANIRIL